MSDVTCVSPVPGWSCLVMDPGAACVTSLRTCPWLPSARAFGARAFQAGHVRRRYVPATFCSRLRRSGVSGGTCSTPLCPGYLLLAPSALGRFRRDMFDAAMSWLPSARAFGARAFQAGHVRRRYVLATFCSRLRRSGVSGGTCSTPLCPGYLLLAPSALGRFRRDMFDAAMSRLPSARAFGARAFQAGHV